MILVLNIVRQKEKEKKRKQKTYFIYTYRHFRAITKKNIF